MPPENVVNLGFGAHRGLIRFRLCLPNLQNRSNMANRQILPASLLASVDIMTMHHGTGLPSVDYSDDELVICTHVLIRDDPKFEGFDLENTRTFLYPALEEIHRLKVLLAEARLAARR
jgi:hypothetical protein